MKTSNSALVTWSFRATNIEASRWASLTRRFKNLAAVVNGRGRMTFPLLPQHTDECSFDFSCPVAFEIREVVGGAGPDLVLTSTWGGEALVEIAQHGNPTNVEQQLSLGKTSGNALAGIDRVPFLSWLLALQVEGIIKIHSYVGLTDACRETMELYARAVNISVEEGVIGG